MNSTNCRCEGVIKHNDHKSGSASGYTGRVALRQETHYNKTVRVARQVFEDFSAGFHVVVCVGIQVSRLLNWSSAPEFKSWSVIRRVTQRDSRQLAGCDDVTLGHGGRTRVMGVWIPLKGH